MDRSIGNDEREPQCSEVRETGGRREQEHRHKAEPERQKEEPERPGREYPLSDEQRQTMADIGRFRTLSVEDLSRFRYDGDAAKMRQEIRQLSSERLVQTRTLWLRKNKEPLVVVTLTKRGKKLLERTGEEGTVYAGFVKPGEMVHDAAIYRMYQAEAEKITSLGGKIRRVTLDYEFKRRVYSLLAKKKPATPEYRKRQAEIASEHGLKVVRGHIQLPDLRIEYHTREGELRRTDLELATAHYRGGQLAAKAEAGFTFYASGEDRSRLSSVFDDHHITAELRRSSGYEHCFSYESGAR